MGNQNTKEARGDGRSNRQSVFATLDPAAGPSSDRPSSRRRESRRDLGGLLGLGSSGGSGSHHDSSHERRETKQEREARRLEKERLLRIKERERSMREEHVDGGYLVTLGTYQGTEDFNKHIVREYQIARKLAPFWRGLSDFNSQWTEPQIIAAARGLPIPAADETPPEDLVPRPFPAESPEDSNQNINSLTVPMGGRTMSAASDRSVPALASGTGQGSASPFKQPRSKVLAALGGTSRNASTTEIVPHEINLPNDPFVNGQPLEVFLYKDASECPICFLDYPPYLNHTRCCNQDICSECFVQIKRPDPHFPEGHNENDPNHNPEEVAGLLVSEPACCPYCQQPDFGVTYDPPPFRRGLAYNVPPPVLGHMSTAMSSNSSLNSGTFSPTLGSPPASANNSRRRTGSLSANDPNVVITDKIRPEWATKLQAARSHQARRAAAATALHTAAFLMGNNEPRSFRPSRFRRNNGGSGSGSTPGAAGTGTVTIMTANNDGGGEGANTLSGSGPDVGARSSSSRVLLPTGGSSSRRSRIEDLEDMMFAEAIRLSLAAEEERKAKEEKEKKKEVKRQEKEARKAAKAASKHSGPYGQDGPSGHSSASGSSLSLPSFGRKRGNSGASNLRVEASVANAMASTGSTGSPVSDANAKDKGKGVDRGLPSTPEAVAEDSAATESAATAPSTDEQQTSSSSLTAPIPISAPRSIPSPHHPPGPSHLRQMSSVSSISSSLPDSQAGSYTSMTPPSNLQDPRASGLSLGNRSAASEDGGDHDRDPSASTEPMFNFRSLAEVVGVSLEGENAGRRLSRIAAEEQAKKNGQMPSEEVAEGSHDPHKADEANEVEVEHSEDVGAGEGEESVATLKPNEGGASRLKENQQIYITTGASLNEGSGTTAPMVTITPETPSTEHMGEESKQLGYETTTTIERAHEATQ